jgi:hypothetical protein
MTTNYKSEIDKFREKQNNPEAVATRKKMLEAYFDEMFRDTTNDVHATLDNEHKLLFDKLRDELTVSLNKEARATDTDVIQHLLRSQQTKSF